MTQGWKQARQLCYYIMHWLRWRVVKCAYPYSEAVAATSDHSAVIANFEQL
jgi:hypothetical protein